ncbi:tetratricopeptide repeat protein [Mycobacteroides abscessus]|uniref:tetratricopeptide repeat protein n=1 Tax=Mycobacteroides abscessus TaxID=36809 RepID=UPI00094114C6|nr:tetratricopeptide repeat protein [Mycobacteroides abscessus]
MQDLNSPAGQADTPHPAVRRYWLRAWPATLVLGVAVPIVGGIVSIASQFDAVRWLAVALASISAAVAVALAAAKWRSEDAAKRSAEEHKQREQAQAQAKWLRKVQECILWPLPPIGDVDPYTQLGVAPAHRVERHTADQEGAATYIGRDIDPAAKRRLQASGFVLLLGAPGSGVTRTAHQLALTAPTSPMVFAAVVPHGLSTALGELDVLSRPELQVNLLLWLDRIETFTTHGLTATMLRHFGQRSPGLRVVATISTNHYEVWAAENPALAEMFGDPVPLARILSAKEAARAEAAYPELDLSEGLAPAFTNTTTLLRRLRGGNHDCPHDPAADQCALARTIVEIALEWACTDIGRPLPVNRLIVLARQRPGGRQSSDPSHLASAVKWAVTPVIGGAALLVLTTDTDGEQHLAAHPAIVDIWRAETSGPQQPVWTAAVEHADTPHDSEALGRIGFRAQTSANLDAAALAWQKITGIDDAGARWLVQAADYSRGCGDPAAEIFPRERLLELTEATYGRDDLEVAMALTGLGNAWLQLGQPGKALALHQRALPITEAAHGAEDPEVAVVLTNLGNACSELGQPAPARQLYERALLITEHAFGANHHNTSAILTGLGGAWLELGSPERARELYERALPITKERFGVSNPEVAVALTGLGSAWFGLGQPQQSIEFYEQALAIIEASHSLDHPKVAVVLTCLGSAWGDLEHPDRARKLYARALPIIEAAYGPDHPKSAVVLTGLGSAWFRLGQYEQARELYARALPITEDAFGADHPSTALVLTGLGNAHLRLRQPEQARKLYERALSITEETFGADHPKTAAVLTGLASACCELGRPEKARAQYEQASLILHAHLPAGHPKITALIQSMRQMNPQVIVLANGQIIWSPRESE